MTKKDVLQLLGLATAAIAVTAIAKGGPAKKDVIPTKQPPVLSADIKNPASFHFGPSLN